MYYMNKQAAAQQRLLNDFAYFIKAATDGAAAAEAPAASANPPANPPANTPASKPSFLASLWDSAVGGVKDAYGSAKGHVLGAYAHIKDNPWESGIGLGAGTLASYLAYRAARKRRASKLMAALAALGAGSAATAGGYYGTVGARAGYDKFKNWLGSEAKKDATT